MSSGQAHTNYQLHNGPDFQQSVDDVSNLPQSSLDLEQFMMEGNQHSQNAMAHNTPQQLDVLGGHHQFAEFAFPYNGIQDSAIHGESNLDSNMDPYHLASQNSATPHRSSVASISGDHRNSISSIPGDHMLSINPMPAPRSSFSGAGQMGNASGSDDASPTSNRASAALDGGYNDEFGIQGGALDGSDLGHRSREEKNDPNPPWSELKTKAGKERKRLPLACIACRRKKIRCSGEKPACKHCLRSRIPCVYKVTTRKAAPRTDYMAMLDKRLKRMEERIIKIVPKEEQDGTTTSVARANVKPAIPGTLTVRSVSGKKRAADEAFGAELDNWAKAATASNAEGGVKAPSLMIQEVEENKLLSEGAEALPTRDIQEHLAEVFFENLYGQTYHLLHKPSYMRKLK